MVNGVSADLCPTLYFDTPSRKFLSGIGRNARVSGLGDALGPLTGNDTPIALQLTTSNAQGDTVPMELADNLAILLRVRRKNAFATSGSFKIEYAGEISEPIDLCDSLFAIQCKLNNMGTIEAAGGVDVLELDCDQDYQPTVLCACNCKQEHAKGKLQICFRKPGPREELCVSSCGLLPKSDAVVHILCPGSATERLVAHLEFRESILAQIDATEWQRDEASQVKVTTITPGSPTEYERQRIQVLPAPAGGHFYLMLDTREIGPIPVFATPHDVERAFEAAGIGCAIKARQVDSCAWEITFLEAGGKPTLKPIRPCITSSHAWRAKLCWNSDLLCALLATCDQLTADAELKFYDLDTLCEVVSRTETLTIHRTIV